MKKLLLPPVFSFVFSFSLCAQTQDSLRLINLEEVVVSGNKTEERKSDLPHQIDLILQKNIGQTSPLTTADALSGSGAVYVQKSQQGGGSPVLRGFEANRVLLVVDGVRMNNAIYRAGHLQNSISTDPNMMERIEVLQGAGSVIYGTDAIGGVISFFTRKPALGDSTRFEGKSSGYLRYSSANQGVTGHATLNLGNRKWAFLTGVTASDFGDLRSGKKDQKDYPDFGDANFYVKRIDGRDSVFSNSDPDVQRFSGYRQLDILQKILFNPGKNSLHTLNFQLSTTTDVPRYDRLQALSNGQPRFAQWYYGPQERLFVAYELKRRQNSWWADEFRFTPAFQRIGESRHDRGFGKYERNDLVENLKIYSANMDLFKQVDGHEIRYGGELVHNSLESDGTAENIVTGSRKSIASRYPDGSYTTTGLYFSHRWELLGTKLILSDGLRFSSVSLNADFDPQFFESDLAEVNQKSNSQNMHFGVVGTLPAGFRFNLLLSTGFRNPNIDDLGKTFETNGGDLVVANPDLRPEQVFYREIGLTKTFKAQGSLQVNAYVSSLTDAIVVQPFAVGGQDSVDFMGSRFRSLANVNVDKARVWGISANGKFQVAPSWVLRGNLTYTEGRDLTNDVPLDHIPPLYGNVSVAFEKNRCFAQANFLFNGMKKLADYSPSGEDNLNYATPDGTPDWQTWNVHLGYQFTKFLRLQAGVENILDLNYRTFASGINAPGRNFVLSLTILDIFISRKGAKI
ncbi:MAG: TonB-dependent receptor [Bacteroidetes bacterium]|nr:TonB-dependent receptor [Bacteroidota bacterium]